MMAGMETRRPDDPHPKLPGSLAAMRRAIEAPDARALQLAAHGLKCVSPILGVNGMGMLRERMEAAGGTNQIDGATGFQVDLRLDPG